MGLNGSIIFSVGEKITGTFLFIKKSHFQKLMIQCDQQKKH